ncbi:nuclear envelope phosphatase-regulatory subunit 1 homolog [Scaptodrosophila lebanonensis]|uniref:Transmembrane protein 188 n=1 Tax=Drosophila lebanonensis TaxID=7225 RepID=A0A6J2U0T1_DROLE|nr:nuclear envelope phosphatase-regulatory subunit 1 homolog [Scaptodrosophila lebanonensis]
MQLQRKRHKLNKLKLDDSACDDLRAFERRLTEVVSSYRPSTVRWRLILISALLATVISFWYWLKDPHSATLPLYSSLWRHPAFSVSALVMIALFIFGIKKLVMGPMVITHRTRLVLRDFNMSCTDDGKLILIRPPKQ